MDIRPKHKGYQGANRSNQMIPNMWMRSFWGPIICLCLLSACAKAAPIEFQDRTLLSGDPCGAPCWYGIEVGVDNQESIRRTVANLAFLDPDTESIVEVGFGEIPGDVVNATMLRYKCRYQQPTEWCMHFILIDDQLRQIRMYPNYDLSIEELVQSLGKPDYMTTRLMGVERILCAVNLVWGEERVIAIHYNRSHFGATRMCTALQTGAKMDSELLIEAVLYVSEQWVERETMHPCPTVR